MSYLHNIFCHPYNHTNNFHWICHTFGLYKIHCIDIDSSLQKTEHILKSDVIRFIIFSQINIMHFLLNVNVYILSKNVVDIKNLYSNQLLKCRKWKQLSININISKNIQNINNCTCTRKINCVVKSTTFKDDSL